VLASLAAESELLERVNELIKERTVVVDGLRALGLEIPDSQSNFVWLPTGSKTAEWAAAYGSAGLAVRPFTDEPGAGIRITIGEPEANKLVLDVTRSLIG